MKTLFLYLIVALSPIAAFSQNYAFGYEQGWKNGCQCLTTPPNTAYLYRSGSYEYGYKEGQLEGRLKRLEGTSQPQQRPTVTYPKPTPIYNQANLLHFALAQRQQLYNNRVNKLQEMVDDFWYVYTLKSSKYGDKVPKELSDYANEVVGILANQTKADLSDDGIWSAVYNYYVKHRNNVASW